MTDHVQDLHSNIPNLMHPDTPEGKDESENVVVRSWGEIPKFDFPLKDHMELGTALDLIDVETAARITGSRFGYLKNELALMEYGLVLHVMQMLGDPDTISKILPGCNPTAFTPIVPPVMIKPEIFRKAARLSEATKDERYYLPADDLYLIGSAEHTMSPYYMDTTFEESELPKRFVGFSTAFRREAGTYGKDMHGILRVHQFDKIELESFSLPEDGGKEQDLFVAIQEKLLQDLELPYQVMMMCTGDMGDPDYRQIDMNTWIPSQEKYRETHTSDYVTDYQSRRLNTKVKRADGTKDFVHMNDATALAIGRTLIAIVENYQQEDGSVRVPKILQKYVGKETIKSQASN
ncbi:serine--tRNA ligase [candidate division WWE3 bacterium RIFCSPLOWO2_01_FULL_42_11]|uniref:Serine--tRNA ligase n=1 Tax=candidate division WWE3 bacterium RIFCSPLOWO2_01_FULL_42_11 TaxID=1802627 RepID=A0A1F4VS79_UNCKA|nr:MAG: serine--tRNA ligase [candidate division WWE3 bacterium RIFCSPLOWO2_01_FULL_42_11]